MNALQLDFQHRVRTMVAAHPLFSCLSREHVCVLADKLTTQQAQGGSVIVEQGDALEGLYLVMSGRVKLSITGDNGREITLAVLRAGELFGEISAFDGGASSANAIALYPSTLLILRPSDLAPYLALYPELSRRLLTELARRLRRADQAIAELALYDVPQRILRRLRDLAEVEGSESPEGVMLRRPPTHQDLANMVGSCRETVCRAVAVLVRQGLLAVRGKSWLVTGVLGEARTA